MPKEDIHSQLEQEGPWQGEGASDTESRVARRMLKEILPWMARAESWLERKDSLTRMAITQTLNDPDNFNRAPQESWISLLEEFAGKKIELLILRNPLDPDALLRPGNTKGAGSERKNPLIARLAELGEGNLREGTLLVAWHLKHGLLACESNEEPISENCRHFPKLRRTLHWAVEKDEDAGLEGFQVILWSWDRKNFLK
jgi:hypothetical protein